MFDVEQWVCELQNKILAAFGSKLLFLGYQGSYRRKEATENSDIDIVAIFESLGVSELKKYRQIIESMPYKEKACGFISSKKEIKNWSKNELFHLYYDTKPVYGSLENFIPKITDEDAILAVQAGAQNIYHLSCHSYLYSSDKKDSLNGLFKCIFFVLQAKYFCENKKYIFAKSDLLKYLSAREKKILEISINRHKIKDYNEEEVDEAYKLLIDFCSDNIKFNNYL